MYMYRHVARLHDLLYTHITLSVLHNLRCMTAVYEKIWLHLNVVGKGCTFPMKHTSTRIHAVGCVFSSQISSI